MREIIVLAGGYRLPAHNASAVRAMGMASLFRHLGYEVLVLGKFDEVPKLDGGDYERQFDGIHCRDIRQPVGGRRFPTYVRSAEPIMAAIDHVDSGRVKAILAYNYPARGAYALIRSCRARGIAPVLDCTEWYGWEGRKILRNLSRLTGVAVRMRALTRLAGNVICASSWFQQTLPGQHTLRLPFVLDTSLPQWARETLPAANESVRLVYSGSAGIGMHKDRLPLMIEALSRLAHQGMVFDCVIAGLTTAQYLAEVPAHASPLAEMGERVRFLGRIPHSASIELLRSADFSVFFREPNRVSHTGFSTKYVEAATLGVPVITNETSDIPLYLRDGENGILAAGIAPAQLLEALQRAVLMTPAQRAAMRTRCAQENPFEMLHWAVATKDFLDHLRGVHD